MREKGREKRKRKDTEKEKVKVSVLHGCSKHKSTRFDIYVYVGKTIKRERKAIN